MFSNNVSNQISISSGSILRFFLILLGIFLIWILRDLVLVVLTSIVIASFIEAAIPFFKKIKVGRVSAVVTLYVLTIGIFAGLFYLFAPLLITELYNLATVLSSYAPGVDFLNYFQSEIFSGATDVVAGLNDKLSLNSLLLISQEFISNLSGGFFTTLSVAFGSLFNFILIIVISFYFSVQEKGIENFLRIILPIKHEAYAIDLWTRSRRKIGLWMKGQMLLGVLVAVLTYLVISLIGAPYAFLLSLIAGLMELVPYGILIALIPAVTFSYLAGGISLALMIAGAYIIIHQFEIFLFSPLIIRKVVGLSPLIIILSILVGYELGGFWGLILAIPGAVVFVEVMNDLEKSKSALKIKDE